jgi:DNA-binding PadR family transcriptional regulator
MSQESQKHKGDGQVRSRREQPEEGSEKMEAEAEMEAVHVDIPTVDSRGNRITLRDVPVEKSRSTGQILIDPAVVARAEAEYIASKLGVEPREVPILLLLYAKAGYFVQGVIPELSKFHKLLFYQSKRLENLGLGTGYVRHEFRNARGGPVSETLKDDLRQLVKEGILAVEWSENVENPTTVSLTDKGMALAEKIWSATPEPIRAVSSEVKEDLYPMSGAAIREKVHGEYPLNRRVYSKRSKHKTR